MSNLYKTAISYSWDDEAHNNWVRDLATQLRGDGVDVTLDQWHLGLGGRLPEFMERIVRDSHFVLIIGTQGYKDRFDGRKGGVGYEGHIISAEILGTSDTDKFIPVLRSGDWTTSFPTALMAVKGVDLRGDPFSGEQYRVLVRSLHGARDEPPPLGNPPTWLKAEVPGPPIGSVTSRADKDDDEAHDYFRIVEISSVTQLDRSPAEFWAAGQAAILVEAAWPLSLYWYEHTGGDPFVRREILPDGFRTEYKQTDALVDRSESLLCANPGRIAIRETQEFSNRHRDGGFPYDIAIATTADAIRFGVSLFKALPVEDGNEITVKISWHGIKERFITADTFRVLPSYQQRRSHQDRYSSPTLQFRLGEWDRHLLDHIRRLVGGLFNQFDMFDPTPEVYSKVLEHWKNLNP